MPELSEDDPDFRRQSFGDVRDDFDDEFGRVLPPRELVRRRLRVPAIAFILSGPLFIAGLVFGEGVLIYDNFDRALAGRTMHAFNLGFGTAAVLLGLTASAIVILGGVAMLRLRRWGLALAAAYVMTTTALVGCYALPFFPFGIAALVVLYRPDVRQEFAARPVQSQHDD